MFDSQSGVTREKTVIELKECAIKKMNELSSNSRRCEETPYEEANAILCEVLKELGFKDLVESYSKLKAAHPHIKAE